MSLHRNSDDPHQSLPNSNDKAVRETNDDAQASKLSCVRRGYFRDDFVHLFVRGSISRPILINRGYYTRHALLRTMILKFLEEGKKSFRPFLTSVPCENKLLQVISLGAGYDTLFFQLVKDGFIDSNVRWIEVDLPEVTQKKAEIIKESNEIRNILSHPKYSEDIRIPSGTSVEIDTINGKVSSHHYFLHPVDLRYPCELQEALKSAKLHSDAPTLILAECVLIYMEQMHSKRLLNLLSEMFQTSVMLIYEQINPTDAFGQQMMINLRLRGCPLLGILADLEAQTKRMKDCGWIDVQARDMLDLHRNSLDPMDRLRIERLEMLDEFEEWNMLQSHYCIVLAKKDNKSSILQNVKFPRQ